MLLGELRAQVARVCGRLVADGLVVGTAGNVSARGGDLVAVTPSGLDYASLTAELVGVHRLDGSPAEAPLQPTSELPLHLSVYAATGAAAIVHTHSPAATAVSALVDEIPAVHYYVALFGGPVAVAPYATYGTDELAAHVVARAARPDRLPDGQPRRGHDRPRPGHGLPPRPVPGVAVRRLPAGRLGRHPAPAPARRNRACRPASSPATASARRGIQGSVDPTVDARATTMIPSWRPAPGAWGGGMGRGGERPWTPGPIAARCGRRRGWP